MTNDPCLSFWQKNPRRNVWQHPLWQAFQEAVGRKTKRFAVPRDDPRAAALVVRHPLPFGLHWLEVPRGPLFWSDRLEELETLLETIEAYGRSQKAVFIRYSPYTRLNVPDAVPARYDHHPEASLVLDLTLSEADLLKQMKPKGRYNIRLAEKHGITVRPSQDVAAFHTLLRQTGNRDGFGIHSQTHYQAMLRSLGDHARLLLATHRGQVIAGGIFVYLDDWGIYYYGASDYGKRDLMAPYLVQWTAIREAKKRGCKQYDFLGIAPENATNHPWAGVTEFKKKFGGQMVRYPRAQEVPLRPVLYRMIRWYKKVR